MAAHRGVLYGLGSDGNNEARAPPATGPMPGLHVWVGERVVVAVAAPVARTVARRGQEQLRPRLRPLAPPDGSWAAPRGA